MTDDLTLEYGLGAQQSPPDERDYQLAMLYDATGTVAAVIPTSYVIPHLPPVYNQGQSPMCVAYSAAGEQQSFDLGDTGHTYLWDFSYFFQRIGGTANGAIVRNAFKVRLSYGYPLLPSHSGNSHDAHRISAYYAVPVTQQAIQQAIMDFGSVILSMPWYHSWFAPQAGVLPKADYQVGGHAITAIGWNAKGLRLRNSWGAGWGVSGDCYLPWYNLSVVWEAWKAVDVNTP